MGNIRPDPFLQLSILVSSKTLELESEGSRSEAFIPPGLGDISHPFPEASESHNLGASQHEAQNGIPVCISVCLP